MKILKSFIILSMLILTYSTAISKQIGTASYYGKDFHGKVMANGEKFDMRKLTVAHRTLPFGTKIQITNTRNNKSVLAVVTDRGPYIKHRIVDVSKSCAKKLDMIKEGTAKVKITIIEQPKI